MTLGVILAPYGQVPGAFPTSFTRTTHGGVPLCPYDPKYNTRGEVGFYHDTTFGAPSPAYVQFFNSPLCQPGAPLCLPDGRSAGLGDIPTDDDMARVRGFPRPVNHGWIWTTQGPVHDIWIPPNGQLPGPPTTYYNQFSPRGNALMGPVFGEAAPNGVCDFACQAAVKAVVKELNDHHKRIFAISALAALFGIGASILASVRTARLMKQERARGDAA